jgi:hypothetical protein
MSPTEFDRVRWQRDLAAERLIDAAVQATETLWALAAHRHIGRRRRVRTDGRGSVGRLFAALLAGDAGGAARELDHVRERLADRTVLYVPLSRGGRPDRIAQARARERMLERLAASLPRLGLVTETVALVQLAKALEARRPPGAASVSEFDRVFESATAAVTRVSPEARCRWFSKVRSRNSPRRLKNSARARVSGECSGFMRSPGPFEVDGRPVVGRRGG